MGISKIVMGLDDKPMWASIERGAMELQKCGECGAFRYPPAPVCPHDLSADAEWTPVSGKGTILSWVVFHKQYFEDHVPPYNSVAIELEEGPIVVSQLRGDEPEGSWIGQRVELIYAEHAGRTQHFARWLKPEAA
ncbi:OB-fold domain-containing protein [uncultured Sphingomonas sp.]|uniref:Zn-ribbon domain-containing OB-fold protein n=1 Tax=uncultured Sphingomonas sp. TaxID=158754 RepID=UPI00261EFEFA|nr:OB-fold domain-containing protein [uncultured Sphingomonas sp.]